jgi:hypothetical protein
VTKLAINYVTHHKQIFESSMDHYMEVKKTHGSIQTLDYRHAAEKVDGNRSSRLVTPDPSDFLCDVELAAKRALSQRPDLYSQFRAVYIDQIISVDEIDRDDLAIITEQVARVLVEKRIYPLPAYFRPKDLR